MTQFSTSWFSLWLALQLVALALGALHVPLWARAPQTTEYAAHIMLATQLAAASVLFPRLLETWRAAVIAILPALPMLLLAGLMSHHPPTAVYLAAGHALSWLLALMLCASALRNERQRLWGIALLGGWAIGGVFLHYAALEAGPTQAIWSIGGFTPIVGALSTLHHQSWDWSSSGANLLLCLPAMVWRRVDASLSTPHPLHPK
jgi:hypothetical protein